MGQRSMKAIEDKEFVASERWKCDRSPSGAHHWIIHTQDMTCKYCSCSKPINLNPFGWSKPDTK